MTVRGDDEAVDALELVVAVLSSSRDVSIRAELEKERAARPAIEPDEPEA